ncbi:phage antirepressor KilAC domain-containing protein [Eubacterium sp. 1001713B170207_170306_E7]|uniref:phage antirepressor KilAC domain-containing protein n=1 Tax=Eubacterium sp. 1001713B170207_170306_E7 TaxID=2787097 RepID=UPI001899976E|nr:phage antirepressor KilAC domain-containing protein [Eubacterium sp. 1001713B170207_170306_E7]
MAAAIFTQTFESALFGRIRTLVEQETAGGQEAREWLVAADVCAALGYSRDASNIVRRHVNPADTSKRRISDANGHPQSMLVVNESGLYALIFGSTRPEAQSFKHYVTAVILPSIRRHGAYMEEEVMDRVQDDPEAMRELMAMLRAETAKNRVLSAKLSQLENRVRELKPAAAFGEAITASEGSISMGDMAKLLRQNGVNIGRNRLFIKLRDGGFLSTQQGSWNKPLQWTMELGYFEIEEGSFRKPVGKDGRTLWSVTRVTPRGQACLVDWFLTWDKEGRP